MSDYIQIVLLAVILALVLQQKSQKTIRRNTKNKMMVLDTCALIDGRIVELVKLGFVPDQLVVPEFVVHELQMLADGSDAHKRERARFGLDVVKELQDSDTVQVIIDDSIKSKQPTDDKLVALAKKLNTGLYTTDYNLNKVADIQGVKVLNVNELAQQLRPIALPGEKKAVKILQKGSNAKQGVGYLEDGTMVVVDDASGLINKIVEVEVTRIHQTMAGKMIFADLTEKPTNQASRRQPNDKSSSGLAKRLKLHQRRNKTVQA